jgi:phage terminase small subunit
MTRTGLIHSRISTTATSTTKLNNCNNIHLTNNSGGSISSRSSNFPIIYQNDYTLNDHNDEIHKIDELIVLELPLKWKFWMNDSSVFRLPLSVVNNNNNINDNNNRSSSSRNDSLQIQFNYMMSKMKDKYLNEHKAPINDLAASSSLLFVSHGLSHSFNSMQLTAPTSSSSDLILLNLEDMELLNQIKTKISQNGIDMLNADDDIKNDDGLILKDGNNNNKSHDSITSKSNTTTTTTTNNNNNNNTHDDDDHDHDDDTKMKSNNETKQPEHIDFSIDDYYEDKPVFYSSITRNDEERAMLKSRLLKFQQYKNNVNNNSNNGIEIINSTNDSNTTTTTTTTTTTYNNNNTTTTTFSLNPLLHSFQAAANPLHRIKSERGFTPTKRRQINEIKHLSESKVPVLTSSSSSSVAALSSIQASSSSSVIVNIEDDETSKDKWKSNKMLKYQETKRSSIQLSSISLNQQNNRNDDFDSRQ